LSTSWFLFMGFVSVLVLALGWALRTPRRPRELRRDIQPLDTASERHVTYLPQIRQALAQPDFDFLSERVSSDMRRRVRRERLHVALSYLAALREDFQRLLRMARVIAALSPEVAAAHEFERIRLTAEFNWRYQLTRCRLFLGFAPLPQLDGLSNLVSGLSVRIEAAMKELGERAALATELASSMDRRGVDLA